MTKREACHPVEDGPNPAVDSGSMAHDGERLRAARLRRGLTREQFAQLTGWPTRTMARWEKDGLPPGSRFSVAVAQWLDADEQQQTAPLTAVRPPVEQEEPVVEADALDELSDGALWALMADVTAALQNRFWVQRANLQGALRTADPLLRPGTQLPFPDHLVEDSNPAQHHRSGG
jgi:transcriptional regulator with XRE-family HTH domain